MNIEYEIYLAATKKLARSISIKSVKAANQINEYISKIYGEDAVNESDPVTWKYYLNLSGQYHLKDEMMTVVSWDTGERINFTQDQLYHHTKTAQAYQFGTTVYKELVKKYPTQETLILGILYPCDINVAINAKDGAILSYPKELVEDNEHSLIINLEKWVQSFNGRWDVPDFANGHDLYVAAQQAIMYLNLLPEILNLRLKACKTYEAHSFHIKQYLISRGISGNIIRYLTKKQSLFLYRNINYILRNSGKQETFAWLVEHIMTERNLPLASYYIRHDDTDHVTNLETTARFKHKKVNRVYESSVTDYLDMDSMLDKESILAPGNPNYISQYAEDIKNTLNTARSNVVETKILESSVVDYEDTGELSLENTLISYWGYFAYENLYTNLVRIENVKTGEFYSLSAKDAYVLAIYCAAKSIDLNLDTVPQLPVMRVFRLPTPSMTDLLSVTDSKYIDIEIINYARSLVPEIKHFRSTSEFANKCIEINKAIKIQKKLMALPEHTYSRALTEASISRLYCDKLCDFEPAGTQFSNWLEARSIDFSSFSRVDYGILYAAIVKDAVGIDFASENTLAGLHSAMIELLKTLSSYSIQFIKQYAGSELISMNFIMSRLGDNYMAMEDKAFLPIGKTDIQSIHTKLTSKVEVDLSPNEVREVLFTRMTDSVNVEIGLTVKVDKPPTENIVILNLPNLTHRDLQF